MPFVLVLAAGNLLAMAPVGRWSTVGIGLQLVAVAWYLWARTTAFRALNDVAWLRAFWPVLASFLITTIVVLLVAGVLLV